MMHSVARFLQDNRPQSTRVSQVVKYVRSVYNYFFVFSKNSYTFVHLVHTGSDYYDPLSSKRLRSLEILTLV